MGKKIPRSLSVFTLAMINVAAISNVKNWPFIAKYGFSSLFYLILAALLFFFPISLVCAELATGLPKKGGVYLWVKEAFGKKWGFLAVWLQWVENIVWYPTVLSFAASTVAYIFDPSLSSSTLYTVVIVLVLFWGSTIANIFGMKTSGWISDIGAICGTLVPAIALVALGVIWVTQGSPIQIPLTLDSFIPSLSLGTVVFFTGVILSFGGMEMSSVHALDVQNPQKNYPKAILLSVFLILIPTALGIFSISVVVDQKTISLTAGTMQAFTVFLKQYNLGWSIPLMAALMAIGLFGSVSTWIIGPTKGILTAGQEGLLPPLYQKTNKHNAPVPIMILQGIITSILTLMLLLMPTVSSGFWILTVLVAQLYLLMYILVFASVIKLRYCQRKMESHYQIPGGKLGLWTINVIGILTCLFALLIGYIPPSEIDVGNPKFYTGFLIGATLLGCLAPLLIFRMKKASWSKDSRD